jgi:hypothetical protein
MRYTLTAACVEADLEDAVNMAVCLGWLEGYRPEEWLGAFSVQRLNAAGDPCRIICLKVGDPFIQATLSETNLTRPEADVEPYILNMAAANRGLDKLSPWTGTGDVPRPVAGVIPALVGLSGREAEAVMGLLQIPV